MYWWVFSLALGATARITRLITADVITTRLRATVQRKAGAGSYPDYLVRCAWCLSLWVAAIVVPLAYLSHGAAWFTIPAAVLTVSHLTALGVGLENEESR